MRYSTFPRRHHSRHEFLRSALAVEMLIAVAVSSGSAGGNGSGGGASRSLGVVGAALRLQTGGGLAAGELSTLPPTAPENVIFNLGVAVAREDLGLYVALLEPAFVFEDCRGHLRLEYPQDQERMRAIFAFGDVVAVRLSIGAARPSSVPDYPADMGFVEVAACWHLVSFSSGHSIVEEADTFVLRPLDPPDAQLHWRLSYWLDRGHCEPCAWDLVDSGGSLGRSDRMKPLGKAIRRERSRALPSWRFRRK
jgi:hypothetical protein